MLLTAATTDLFQKVGSPGSATTLASPGYTIGNSSINVGATTNHPSDTKYTFAIDQAQVVNGVTSRIPGTYCEFEGILGGSNSINSLTLKYGSAQNYPAGSLTRVYIPVSANQQNQLINGLRQDHNGKGNHQNLTDDNGNLWLERNQVASAVNQVRVSNSITGSGVAVEANGSDTNINVHLRGKGTGVAVLKNPELFSNFVASGGVIAQSSGLIGTFSDMAFYAGGDRFKKTSVPNKTYTINKDTYVDADPTNNGTVTYTEVANGAAAPALTSGNIRIAKVVTSGSAITSVTQNGADSLGNIIYLIGVPVSAKAIQNPYKFSVYATTSTGIASAGTQKVILNSKEFDTGNNFDATTNYRFTAPIAGFYLISACCQVSSAGMSGTGNGTAFLYKNGSEFKRGPMIAGSGNSLNTITVNITDVMFLVAGDYIELFAYNGDNTGRNTGTGPNITYMSGMLISQV